MSHNTMLDLSRWQWALTAAMHITFPAVTVGTSVLLVVLSTRAQGPRSLIDLGAPTTQEAPAAPIPAVPAIPPEPSAPLQK